MNEPTPDDVPPPVRQPQPWQPPERRWPGRVLFFGAGVASWVCGFVIESQLQWHGGFPLTQRVEEAVIAVVPVAVGLWIVVQRIRRGPRWRWVSFLCGALFPPVALVVALIGWFVLPDWWRTGDFDEAMWKAESGRNPSQRVWMVDDLLVTHPLVGLPAADLDALLGPDDEDSGDPPPTGDRHRLWTLGPERGFLSIDYEHLDVELDENGIVTRAKVVTD